MSVDLQTPLEIIGAVPIYRGAGNTIRVPSAPLHVDADGSPRAYGPGCLGEDYIANAGRPGNYWGIVTANGVPVVQGPDDPAPGWYVSTTSLQDPGFPIHDPRRYVDSESVPGVVLPGSAYRRWGMRLGDLVLIERPVLALSVWAIFHDVGPGDAFGEATIFSANALKINADPKHGGMDGGIGYTLYPGSGTGKILTADQAVALAESLGYALPIA
jgi:hypothetical protein